MSKMRQSIAKHIALSLMLASVAVSAELTERTFNAKAWQTIITADDFTDEESATAVIVSEGQDMSSGYITLICTPSLGLHGRISTGAYIGEFADLFEDTVRKGRIASNFKYRVDKTDPVTTTLMPDKKSVFFADNHKGFGSSTKFASSVDELMQTIFTAGFTFVIDLMKGKETVVIQLTGYDRNVSKARFTLNGSAAAIKTVLEACNMQQ